MSFGDSGGFACQRKDDNTGDDDRTNDDDFETHKLFTSPSGEMTAARLYVETNYIKRNTKLQIELKREKMNRSEKIPERFFYVRKFFLTNVLYSEFVGNRFVG